MVLSPIGWLSGITALSVFVFSILFGLFAFYKSKKQKSKLFIFLGLVYIFAALVYTGDVLDFFTIIVTGQNIESSYIPMIGLINWIWFPGAVFSAMVFGAWVITPEKKTKWYIFTIYLILAVLFEVFLLMDLNGTVTYTIPITPGVDLINDNLILESFAFIIAAIFLISIFIFLGFGFLRKAVQSTGIIRRKFLYLSLGAFIYIIGAVLDGLFPPDITLIFIRSGMALSAFLFYFGLKTEK